MEAERLVVAQFTAAEAQRESAQPDILTVHEEPAPGASTVRESKPKTKGKKKSSKPK